MAGPRGEGLISAPIRNGEIGAKEVRLVQNADSKACGAKTTAWEFHVVVVTAKKDQFNNGVIDGYLAVDPRTGKMLCANLPLLD